MTQYYQDIITKQSWLLLTKIARQFKFTLIGGWAVYLYTKVLKSKDIDLIVDYNGLAKLKEDYPLVKNDRLKKYEIKKDGVDIDIYVPYYSDLGLKTEELMKYQEKKEGFSLPQKEALILSKLKAYKERIASVKGKKDKIDIVSLLLLSDFNFRFFAELIGKYHLRAYFEILKEIISTTKEMPELNLNRHSFAQRKKEIIVQLFPSN